MTSYAPHRVLDRLLAVVTALLLPVSTWIAITTVVAVIVNYHPLPFGDQWDAVSDLDVASRGEYGISELFRQHNEHRIPFARLLFLADWRWFGASGVFLLASIVAMQLLHGLLLWSVACRRRGSVWLHCAAAVVVPATFFSASQMENFSWGFQVQFTLVYLAATAALVGLVASIGAVNRNAGNAWLAACMLAGFCSTFGMANGLLVWPVLLSAAWIARAPRRAKVAITIVGAVCWVAFFVDYRFQQRVLDAGSPRLEAAARFVATFFGNPVSHMGVDTALLVGSIALGLGLVAAAVALGWSSQRTRAHIVLVHVMAFCFGSAVMAAVGRIPIVGDCGLSSRYATPALVYWCALALLLVSMSVGRGVIACPVGLSATAAIVFALAHGQERDAYYFERRFQTQEQLAIALLMDVRDDLSLLRTHGAPRDYVWKQAQKLRALGVWPYDSPERQSLGAPIERLIEIKGDRVPGGICSASSIDGDAPALRVSGWLDLEAAAQSRVRIALVDERGVVCGFAATDWPRLAPVGEFGWPWRGYCLLQNARAELRAYVVSADYRTAWPLAGQRTVPGTRSVFVGADVLRDAVATDGVQTSGPWSAGAQHDSAAAPPLPGPVFGSWGGADAHTGSITFGPIDARVHRSLALPIYLGPGTPDLHIVLRRSDGTQLCEVRELHDDVVQNSWLAWRVDFADDVRGDVEIVITDAGSEWGQWLATARPVWLDD